MEENYNTEDQQQKQNLNYPARPKLQRALTNRVLLGVCGGISDYFKVDAFIVRLLFLLSIFFGGWGIIIYFIAAIAIPRPEKTEDDNITEFDANRLKAFAGFTLIFLGIYLLLNRARFLFNNFFGFSYELFIPFILFFQGMYFFLSSHIIVDEQSPSKLSLSKDDFRIAGVCGGLAKYFNSDSSLVRFQWIIFTVFSLGAGILVYILFMFTIPKEENDFAAKD